MKNQSAKRISGYGVAIATTLAALPSTADIIYYPGLNETGTTPSTTAATILSFNLAGDVATDGSHVANEQFFAAHAYAPATSTPATSTTPGTSFAGDSKLTFNANASQTVARLDKNPLAYGTLIGSGQTVNPNSTAEPLTGHSGSRLKGDWTAGQEAYIGLKFDNAGGTNYGWADITTVNVSTITLNSFAYDNTGGPIAAGSIIPVPIPEPSQIALFALGAAGIAVYQRRRKNSSIAR